MDPSQQSNSHFHLHRHHHSLHNPHRRQSLSQQHSSSSLASAARLIPQMHNHISPSASMSLRTTQNTPVQSPGLFCPPGYRYNAGFQTTSVSESNTPAVMAASPFLHPLQMHKVRETHKALIDSDITTGRKTINQYEVIEEIGRGMHGKVKLARNIETLENVAIKIIPRFSKRRRLGKVTAMSPQDKTKKEIAILKKIRHPNVVALLEVIDDPELKKIYMVLEHCELGEVVWRKKGLPHICSFERRRIEREMRGEPPTPEEEKYEQILERRQALKELKRAKMAQNYANQSYWSVEHGAADEPSSSVGSRSRASSKEDFAVWDGPPSRPISRQTSRNGSRGLTRTESTTSAKMPPELDEEVDWEDDLETPGPLRSNPASSLALDGTMYGAYMDDIARVRSPSMADSIISHMSSVDYNPQQHDPFADDFSYVPCFTLDQARATFRDTVLGLEYLHYQGVVHRDIKPANLLWSKDHRVKISDFGVSYFGRPIRDGELDDTVSESEAKDFDDDLELAKTVGTPAFFAPELCYTDVEGEQPRVSEQIDVWSLGVTLYCLIYARIPFLAEDEFQMFKKIATEEVYIPRRRLKPVDPLTSPAGMSLYKRQNRQPYRDDNDLEYEDVDNLLCDLLRQMLTKNPDKRIRLRDIKRHPWVLQGIPNPVGWLDDTDPSRPSSGRKIQVDEREMSSAVVPLTFLERARSVVKKTIGKVMHPLVDRSESKSRRRATSSAASSAGDSMANNSPPTPQPRMDRRRSLRPDDYFTYAIKESSIASTEHPLAVSQSVSPEQESVAYDPLATILSPADIPRGHAHSQSETIETTTEMDKSPFGSSFWPFHRHSLSHGKLTNNFLSLTPHPSGSQTTPATPCAGGPSDLPRELISSISERQGRDTDSVKSDDSARSRSIDRGLFASSDKRAQPRVGLSNTVAPGSVLASRHLLRYAHRHRSIDLGVGATISAYASLPPLQIDASAYQHNQPQSDSQIHGRRQQEVIEERPSTANRVGDAHQRGPTRVQRNYSTSNPESFIQTKQALTRNRVLCLTEGPSYQPSSEDDEDWRREQAAPSRGETLMTGKSSSIESMDMLGTPLTSPSEVTSPTSINPRWKGPSERMMAFRSDPSLPALLSGASSVSADPESELLNLPGIVSGRPSLLETTDSLTPPALMKESAAGFPLDQVFANHCSLGYHAGSNGSHNTPEPGCLAHTTNDGSEEDDDSDEDEFLVMASKKKAPPPVTSSRPPPFEARRRDTNISIASTETAKRVGEYTDDIPRSEP